MTKNEAFMPYLRPILPKVAVKSVKNSKKPPLNAMFNP
jgi:hypothetical protein